MAETDSLREYLQGVDFGNELQDFRQNSERKTGFSNWDEIIKSLYPGLYVLGATSSLGKTSFCLQLAEQLAKNGEYVIYFSLEQTKLEMATKCLSRNLYLNGSYKASAINIRRGILDNGKKITTELDETIATYSDQVGDRLNIIECDFKTTIEDIIKHIDAVVKEDGIQPIVFIDYLQILKTEAKKSDKERIDHIVGEIKDVQKRNKLVFFLISSLNRAAYLSPIDYESFKESGGIEFTADVMLGLQLQAIHAEIFDKENKLKQKRETLAQASRELPRKVELVCKKNRYGIKDYSLGFDYFPQYDLFLGDNDFRPADLDGSVPFLDEEEK